MIGPVDESVSGPLVSDKQFHQSALALNPVHPLTLLKPCDKIVPFAMLLVTEDPLQGPLM